MSSKTKSNQHPRNERILIRNGATEKASKERSYADWGERLVEECWAPYLLTFMFAPTPGSPVQVAAVMEAEVARVYATLLPRIIRNPTRLSSKGRHPIWICCLDYPVFKRDKISKIDAFVNDGLHTHAAAFIPPWSRQQEDLVTHFEIHRSLYTRSNFPLARFIHCWSGYLNRLHLECY